MPCTHAFFAPMRAFFRGLRLRACFFHCLFTFCQHSVVLCHNADKLCIAGLLRVPAQEQSSPLSGRPRGCLHRSDGTTAGLTQTSILPVALSYPFSFSPVTFPAQLQYRLTANAFSVKSRTVCCSPVAITKSFGCIVLQRSSTCTPRSPLHSPSPAWLSMIAQLQMILQALGDPCLRPA